MWAPPGLHPPFQFASLGLGVTPNSCACSRGRRPAGPRRLASSRPPRHPYRRLPHHSPPASPRGRRARLCHPWRRRRTRPPRLIRLTAMRGHPSLVSPPWANLHGRSHHCASVQVHLVLHRASLQLLHTRWKLLGPVASAVNQRLPVARCNPACDAFSSTVREGTHSLHPSEVP